VLGHSYYGKVLPDQFKYVKKFAWSPTISNSGKRIWLSNYYIRHTFYDNNGRPPIKGPSWECIFTKNEYLLIQIKGA